MEDQEGIRLAKRVAAQAGCSRREAELLIENGAVRVDGTRV
ncbi:S4 domain-containing protein, partial [Ligilactobacillus salivarius]